MGGDYIFKVIIWQAHDNEGLNFIVFYFQYNYLINVCVFCDTHRNKLHEM